MHKLAPLFAATLLFAAAPTAMASPVGLGPALIEEGTVAAQMAEDGDLVDDDLLDKSLVRVSEENLLGAYERRARAQPGSRAETWSTGSRTRGELRDPLFGALLDFEHGVPVAAPTKRPKGPPETGAEAEFGLDSAPLLGDDVELLARIDGARQGLDELTAKMFSPMRAADGGINFNLLGVGDFHYSSAGGQMSLAFRDVSFSMPALGSGPGTAQRSGQPHAGSGANTWSSESERNLLYKLLFLFWDIASHPFAIAMMVVAGLFRLASALAARSPAY